MFHNVTLEASLKPFKQTDSEYIRQVVEKIYDQWRPLIKNRAQISIMLWTADGSELLDYAGNLDDEFQWCMFVGGASNPLATEEDVKAGTYIHHRRYPYMENPPKMTYRILKEIIATFKAVGKALYPDTVIRVGETLDIGPEFAVSDFKYNRHTEVTTLKAQCDGKGFLDCSSVLKGDTRPYAAYPQGIPDGTPFGTFLGKQAQIFLTDLGFDYLWLSNGVGFSAYPWDSDGVILEGETFHTENFAANRQNLFSFWKLLRAEMPDYPIEVRGTNYSAGIDYASDAVPLYDLYRANLNILPPPNSPWAALDGDYGLELMGHMTRTCELPGKDLMFRYYVHDPWWANSPWYDRYEGQPHDIYLPMSLSRIDERGKTQSANYLNILSVDNSFGGLPESCANEPIPHLLKAEKDCADEPSPFVWVYPFREYTTTEDAQLLHKILSGDWFICSAISNGLPLSTIVSCDNFQKHDPAIYNKSILLTPVPEAGTAFEKCLLERIEQGQKVLVYGAADRASEAFKKAFGLTLTDGICGEIPMDPALFTDVHKDGRYPSKMLVGTFLSGGDVNTKAPGEVTVLETENGYALATVCHNAIWYRATVGGHLAGRHAHIAPDDGGEFFRGEVLLRKLLARFGYHIHFTKPNGAVKTPILMINRSNNALVFSTYAPSTTVETHLKFPLGAPLLLGYETELIDGYSSYRFPRSEHKECRVYIQQEGGIVNAFEDTPSSFKFRRRIAVTGLQNATVRFFGESYCAHQVKGMLNSRKNGCRESEPFDGGIVHSEEYGTYFEARNVTGEMRFLMPFERHMDK